VINFLYSKYSINSMCIASQGSNAHLVEHGDVHIVNGESGMLETERFIIMILFKLKFDVQLKFQLKY
jgi:hypothetical protein